MANSISSLLDDLQTISENDHVKLHTWCNRLCEYYKENERHSYSEITAYILSCDGGIEYMERIIPVLKNMQDSLCEENKSFRKNIGKLIDHIQLEIQRIQYINETIKKTTTETYRDLNNDQLDNFNSLHTSTQKALAELKEQADDITEKVQDTQKEYISILGIFAAVVLSFNGGMIFSSSVLENINTGSIFRVTMISLLLGGILINLIYLLILFIINITRLEKDRKWTYPKFMHIINVVLGVLIVLLFFFWFIDIHYLADRFRKSFIY